MQTTGALEVAAAPGTNAQIQFLGTASVFNRLILDRSLQFGTITGTTCAGPLLQDFTAGDVINLRDVTNSALTLTYAAGTGDLTVQQSGAVVAMLQFEAASLGAGTFKPFNDGVGGTFIKLV